MSAEPETDRAASRRPARRRLQASELRYRRLFEAARDGILILDAASRKITDVNPYMVELLGFSATELLGKELWEIGLLKDADASQEAFRELEQKGYIRYDTLPLKTKEGKSREVEFVSNVYAENSQRVIQCNIRNVTERKLAEEAARKANEELRSLVAELQRRDDEMQLLNRMNDLLQTCNTQDEAFRVISMLGSGLFPGQSGGIAVLHASRGHLETVVRWGDATPLETIFAMEDCWALRRGAFQEVVAPAVGLCRHFARQGVTDYLCAPLMVQGDILGLLSLVGPAATRGKHQVSQQHLAVMVGESIKLCLSNLRLREKLHSQAIQDPLTGLFNRRYLENTLWRELHRAQRLSTPLGVVMLDLDYFKRFNDTFGHECGDLLLREVGQLLREKLRKSDIACRYGGEEFVLVLPESSLANTEDRVNEVRELIKEVKIRHGDQLVGGMAASAGIAGAPEHGFTAAELLGAADKAMYAAKQAGRDRVVVYQGMPP